MNRILSYIYYLLVEFRFFLYKYNILKSYQFNIPIISIGNIMVGGTGKTPMVSWIVAELEKNDKKICVISRGYKRQKQNMAIVDGDTNKKTYTSNQIGDEPLLLLNKHPNIKMVIGNNKIQSINTAINTLDIDIIVIDDGFQSLYIKSDFDIVMINSDSTQSDYKIIPLGYARESYKHLNRADCIVVNQNNHDSQFNKQIIEGHGGRANVFYANKKYVLKYENKKHVDDLSRLGSLIAICGIANPNSFLEALDSQNISIKAKHIYSDHYNYTEHDMKNIYQSMKNNNINTIITTSKDYNKIAAINIANKDIVVLDMNFDIEHSNKLISMMENLI